MKALTLAEALSRPSVWLESSLDGGRIAERRLAVRDWQIEVQNMDGFAVYWIDPAYYGVTDRAWDERPDDATRKKTPWKTWPDCGQGIDVYSRRKKRR